MDHAVIAYPTVHGDTRDRQDHAGMVNLGWSEYLGILYDLSTVNLFSRSLRGHLGARSKDQRVSKAAATATQRSSTYSTTTSGLSKSPPCWVVGAGHIIHVTE